jgi:hypothetical protein
MNLTGPDGKVCASAGDAIDADTAKRQIAPSRNPLHWILIMATSLGGWRCTASRR